MSERISVRRRSAVAAAVGVVSFGAATSAFAAPAVTASSVVQYNPGTLGNGFVYDQPSWTSGPAIGLPAPTEGGIYGDNSVITPFNAAYNPANVVGVGGAGGLIEFHLSSPVATNGYTLSVQADQGLSDASYPSGTAMNPAVDYNTTRSATVLVSQDGVRFVSLGDRTYSIPTNAYADVSAAQTSTPGTIPADFSKPFTGTLSSFNGETFSQVLSTLNGSGGGDWLNLSGTGLSSVNYVEFQTAPGETMYVNAVTGVAVPEPGSVLTLLGVGCVKLVRRRARASLK